MDLVPPAGLMTTPASSADTNKRRNLRSQIEKGKTDRGADLGADWLKQKWPELLDAHYKCEIPGPSACLQDALHMIAMGKVRITCPGATKKKKDVGESRPLSDFEKHVIKTWYDLKDKQLVEKWGDAYITERNLSSAARAYHEENKEAHAATHEKLEKLDAKLDRLLIYHEMKAKEVSCRYGWIEARETSKSGEDGEGDEGDEDDEGVEFYYDEAADEVYQCAGPKPPQECKACELVELYPFPKDPEKVNYKICDGEKRYGVMEKADVLKFSDGVKTRSGCKLNKSQEKFRNLGGVVIEEHGKSLTVEFKDYKPTTSRGKKTAVFNAELIEWLRPTPLQDSRSEEDPERENTEEAVDNAGNETAGDMDVADYEPDASDKDCDSEEGFARMLHEEEVERAEDRKDSKGKKDKKKRDEEMKEKKGKTGRKERTTLRASGEESDQGREPIVQKMQSESENEKDEIKEEKGKRGRRDRTAQRTNGKESEDKDDDCEEEEKVRSLDAADGSMRKKKRRRCAPGTPDDAPENK